jgi:DNA-binding MarR family transcriptional regulator
MTRFVDHYLLYLMAQASHRISAEFHDQLAAEGVPVSTWRILASLYPDAALSVGQLAQACLTKQSTMTRQVDRLTEAGLLTRAHSATDRRRVSVSLTKKGASQAGRLVGLAEEHERRVLANFDPKKISGFKAVLAQMTELDRG